MRFPLFRRKQDDELEEEIRTHLELAARDRVERGEAPEAARLAARREFGNTLLAGEQTRETWGWTSLERMMQDVRYGLRILRKSPAFSIISILTLALGIGANTVLFSVVANVLLAPLSYPHPEQLVAIHESKPNFPSGSISYPNFRDWREQNRRFDGMAIYRRVGLSLTGMGQAEQVNATLVSSDFFGILGIKPVLGRSFAAHEDEIGAAPQAILGESLWRSRFAASPDVLGKAITLDGRPLTIIGVIPSTSDTATRFVFPTDVFIPIGQWTNPLLNKRGAGLGIHGIGRLRPGVTLAQAQDDMARVTRNLANTYPDDDKHVGATLVPLKESVVGNVKPILIVLQIAVGFVLLIACVNVANLLLARSAARETEFATRAALGAGSGRILRQLLTESLLLGGVGGVLGFLLASYGTHAALAALPVTLPRSSEVGTDVKVLGFTAAISVFAGLLFGLAPALRLRSTNLRDALQQSGRALGGARTRTLGAFVVAQIAMALVLLIGAGLMVRSLRRLWDVNPGFDARGVMTFNLSLSPAMMQAPADAIRAAFRDVQSQINATPGIQAGSVSWGAVPFSYDDERLFWIDGHPKPASESDMNWTLSYVVGPDYLKVMHVPLLRGRFLEPGEDERAPHVAVIDDVFAERFFPGQNPIGQRLHMNMDPQAAEIVGVVGHVKQWGLDRDDTQPLRAQLYTPFMQLSDEAMKLSPSGITVFVRYSGDSESVVRALRETSQRVNAEQVIFGAQTMETIITASLAGQRIAMILLAAFASLALVLACGGLYGVVSYVVAQRTHEIGLRMALGAPRGRVLQMVLGHGARLSLVGISIGLCAAAALTRLMAGLLYGIKPFDLVTFGGVAVLLSACAMAACWIPATRATLVDPTTAIRQQ